MTNTNLEKFIGLNILNFSSQELKDLEKVTLKYHEFERNYKEKSRVALLPANTDVSFFKNGHRLKYGHTSYFSSILNCFFTNTKQISSLCALFNSTKDALFKPNEKENWNLTKELGLFYRLMGVLDSNHKDSDPKELESRLDALQATYIDMCEVKQHIKEVDAFEFLRFLLRYLDKTCAVIEYINKPTGDVKKRLSNFENTLGSFLKYYDLKLHQRTHCNLNQDHKFDTKITVSFLQLETQIQMTKHLFATTNPSTDSLYNSMAIALADYFLCKTTFGELSCSTCLDSKASSTSRMKIYTPPKMVIIKRNIFDEQNEKKGNIPKIKINCVLDLGTFMTDNAYNVQQEKGGIPTYVLRAICFHEGESAHDGYYTSLVRTSNHVWYRHDIARSTKVTDVQKYLFEYKYESNPSAEFSTINPYILFYALEDITNNSKLLQYNRDFDENLNLIPKHYQSLKENYEYNKDKRANISKLTVTRRTPGMKRPEHSNYNIQEEQQAKKSTRFEEDLDEQEPTTSTSSNLKRDKHSDYDMNYKQRMSKNSKLDAISDTDEMLHVPFTGGYNNPGTHCFINVIIHSLTSMRPLLSYITIFDRTHDHLISLNLSRIIEKFLQIIQINLNNHPDNLPSIQFVARQFKDCFKGNNINMNIDQQQDTHEAFERFLLYVNNWMNSILEASTDTNHLNDKDKFRNIFMIFAIEQYNCNHCNQVYERQDRVNGYGNGLQLNFARQKNIYESIDITLDEQVDDYTCQLPNCGLRNKTARKRSQFLELPSIMVLQLKLFEMDKDNVLFYNFFCIKV
jgi:hypothetical protein